MGFFYDNSNPNGNTFVFITVDTTQLAALNCQKDPVDMVRDFVNRTNLVNGLVIFRSCEPVDINNPTRIKVGVVVVDPIDVAALNAGMPIDWADCSTEFTPYRIQGATNHYLMLHVAAQGMVSAHATPVAASLLV